MKSIKLFLIFLITQFVNYDSFAQIAPNTGITISTFPLNPQSGAYNYFGINVTLDQVYDQNITVNGYIFDSGGSADQNNPFSITILAGDLNASTSATFYKTGATSDAATSWASVYPSNVTKNGLTFSTQGFSLGNIYANFDSQFSYVGEFHNNFLLNSIASNTVPTNASLVSGAINDLKDFNKLFYLSQYSSYFGTTVPLTASDALFEEFKNFVFQPDFKTKLLTATDHFSLDSAKVHIQAGGVINTSNVVLFNKIVGVADSNLNGQLNNFQTEQSLARLANEWVTINSGYETTISAQVTGSVLAIGLKSAELWRQTQINLGEESDYSVFINSTVFDNRVDITSGPNANDFNILSSKNYFVPLPVAMDLAGALVSAGINTGVQYYNNGSVNGKMVLASAMIGAVTGSTGIVGKIGRWLARL